MSTDGRRRTDTAEGNEGLLHRWSQRKLATRAGAAGPAEASPAAPPAAPVQETGDRVGAPGPDPTGPSPDTGAEAPPDLPPIDELGRDSDYSPFLAPEVDDRLRQLALRKLFHLPQFNLVDDLDDYAEDYTAHTPLGGLVTHEMRAALKRQAEHLTEEDNSPANKPEPDPNTPVVLAPETEPKPVQAKASAPATGPNDAPGSNSKLKIQNSKLPS